MNEEREPNGKFKRGVSGNPKGRATLAATKLREKLAEHSDEIVDKLMTLVRANDTSALKMVLDRIAPALRSETLPSCLPSVERQLQAGADVPAIARTVLLAIATGELDTRRGADVLKALGSAANLAELEELRQRIEQLASGTPGSMTFADFDRLANGGTTDDLV